MPIHRDLQKSNVNGAPSWGSAPDLVRQQILIVLSDRRSLHYGISNEAFASIILASESASEVGEFSESLEVISFAPEEIGSDHQGFVFVCVSKLGGWASEIWVFVVPEHDIVLGEVAIWVHHVDRERVELDVLVGLKDNGLIKCVNRS